MAATALITGASSGIGLDLARLFAKDGSPTILSRAQPGQLEAALSARDVTDRSPAVWR